MALSWRNSKLSTVVIDERFDFGPPCLTSSFRNRTLFVPRRGKSVKVFTESTRNLATVATLNDHYLILQMFLIQQVDFDIIRHPFVCSLAHTQCSSRYYLSFLLSGTLLTSPKEHKIGTRGRCRVTVTPKSELTPSFCAPMGCESRITRARRTKGKKWAASS